jgi:hypothetical protein
VKAQNESDFWFSDSAFELGQAKYLNVRYLALRGRLDRQEDSPTDRVIDSLAKFIMAHPVLKFDIEVHSETIGDDKFNQSVSDLRAREIRNYLISLGVPQYQFVCIARGECCPIYKQEHIAKMKQEDRYECDHLNLRTILVVTGVK